MGERMASGESTPFTADEDTAIRKRVRELTSQVLQHGRVDTEAVKDVVRAVAGGSSSAVGSGAEANEPFADAVRSLGDGLKKSAAAAHDALQQLALLHTEEREAEVNTAAAHAGSICKKSVHNGRNPANTITSHSPKVTADQGLGSSSRKTTKARYVAVGEARSTQRLKIPVLKIGVRIVGTFTSRAR
jgi:hypothetical protein